jgi:hypothetical protein
MGTHGVLVLLAPWEPLAPWLSASSWKPMDLTVPRYLTALLLNDPALPWEAMAQKPLPGRHTDRNGVFVCISKPRAVRSESAQFLFSGRGDREREG